jgi:hypothetical protein
LKLFFQISDNRGEAQIAEFNNFELKETGFCIDDETTIISCKKVY